MKTYTVIVGRPDTISDDPITDTFLTYVEGACITYVQDEAKREAWRTDNEGQDEDDAVGDPLDYVIVAVIEGIHKDLKTC